MEQLEVSNLKVSYGEKTVLDNVNLQLNKGEVTILLGLNGAGKTTLLKSISGLTHIDNGEIVYDNKNILKLKSKDKGKLIAYIPQHIHTNQNYTVEDIILMGITPYLGTFQMPSKEHYELVNEILKELNISHLKNKEIGELSGGERRMVYLGRILIQKCSILLLDEPNTFLDYVKQHDFFIFIKDFIKRKNLITLITLHDINLALRYGDRIVILNNNKIVDVVECNKEGYEKKFIHLIEKVYERKFQLHYTDKGPMVIF